MSRAQWNGTFRLHTPDPSHRAFGYCSCKQDTKERHWGQQFCQMERAILPWVPEAFHAWLPDSETTHDTKLPVAREKKTSGTQGGAISVRPTKMTRCMYQPKFPEFWVEWKAPQMSFYTWHYPRQKSLKQPCTSFSFCIQHLTTTLQIRRGFSRVLQGFSVTS